MKTIFLLRICQESLKKTLIVTDWKLFNSYFDLIFTRRFDFVSSIVWKIKRSRRIALGVALLQQGHANVKVHLSLFRLLSKFTLNFILLSHLKNRNNLSNSLAAYRPAKILNTSCEDRSGTHNFCVKHCSIF